MEYLIEVTMGDHSGDGHKQKDTRLYNSPVKASAVSRAYKKGTKIVGWDLTADVATHNADNTIDKEKLARLRELGYATSNFEEDYYNETKVELSKKGKWGISPEDFVDMWAFIVELGGVKLEYVSPPELNIGGYGVFL